MKNGLVKEQNMYYPYTRLQFSNVCRHAIATFLFIAVTALSQKILWAQSDEEVALDLRNHAYAFQQQGEFKQAMFYYTRAIALDPDNPDLYNDKGLMEEYLGKKDDARDDYLKALEHDRKYLPATTNLGMLYAKEKQYTLAVQYLKQRVELGSADDPWTLEAQSQLNQIYEEVPALRWERIKNQADSMSADISRAKENMRRSAEKNRKIGFATAYESGLSLLKEKRYDEAIQSLEAALALEPRSMAVRHALKRANFDKNKAVQDAQDDIDRMENKQLEVADSLDELSGESTPTISQVPAVLSRQR
jgi:tetratricopeptide (TPR) repeat protein